MTTQFSFQSCFGAVRLCALLAKCGISENDTPSTRPPARGWGGVGWGLGVPGVGGGGITGEG